MSKVGTFFGLASCVALACGGKEAEPDAERGASSVSAADASANVVDGGASSDSADD